MTANLTGRYLRLGLAYVPEQGKLIDHSLIGANVEEHGSAPAMLGKDHGLAGKGPIVRPGRVAAGPDFVRWTEISRAPASNSHA